MKKIGILGFVAWLTMLLVAPVALASDDVESKAHAAVSDILFDADADDFTSFRVNAKGFADVTFASNTPDELYSELLGKLKAHPDIAGVLAGKSGPTCTRF